MPHTMPITMPTTPGTLSSFKLTATAATSRSKAKSVSHVISKAIPNVMPISMPMPMPITLPLQAETPPATPPRQLAHSGRNQGLLKTEFSSHLRSSFRQAPADRTGELVRLLEDIAAATQSIRAYVSHAGVRESGMAAGETGVGIVTRMMYETLCHDGYACMILERRHEVPLTFAETALQGGYVVMLTVLDGGGHGDGDGDGGVMGRGSWGSCGTSFSIYARRSSPSTRGRWQDLQQALGEQVAAGYVVYASTTHLVYTMGRGVYKFHLHPVAAQFFSFSNKPLMFGARGDDGLAGSMVYTDYSGLRVRRRFDGVALGMVTFVRRFACKVFFNGCFVEDFDAAVACGGVLLWYDVHLLCSAGPMALIVEQMGGKATDGSGTRILDLCVEDEQVHRTTTFLAGPKRLVDEIEAMSASMMDIQ